VNAPLLSFNEGSGRYEAPAPGGGGFGGEHEGGYQIPSGAPPQQYGGHSGFGGQHEHEQAYQVPSGPPPPQQQLGGGSGFGGQHEQAYQVPSGAPPPQHQGNVGGGGGGGGFGGEDRAGEVPPGLPPRRTGTAAALPQGQDRSHQVEVMQSYEMSRPQTEDEVSLPPFLPPSFPTFPMSFKNRAMYMWREWRLRCRGLWVDSC
jgi:hypothetical protein